MEKIKGADTRVDRLPKEKGYGGYGGRRGMALHAAGTRLLGAAESSGATA